MSDLEEKTPSADFRFIGKPVVRKEDERLTTGRGRFSDDFSVDGQAFAVMVRSPYPHARILGVDAASAKAMPGVLGVLSGADCLADGLTALAGRDPADDVRARRQHAPGVLGTLGAGHALHDHAALLG